MKQKLHLLLTAFLLILCGVANAQINYTQGFEDENHLWDENESFELIDEEQCTGLSSFYGWALYWEDVFTIDAITQSPSIGASSGMPATLSYTYKLITVDSEDNIIPVSNAADWGTVTVEYATSPSGPWTVIETINNLNHTEAVACAPRISPSFTPTVSQTVYLRFTAVAGAISEINQIYFFIDDISVTQAPAPGCTTTPAASAAQASLSTICTTEPVTLSLSPLYTVSGLNFQWQSSNDNVTYTNLAGSANAANIEVLQTASTWYRAIITCSNGGTSVTSAPIQVLTTGLPCYCVPVLSGGVETITRVNIGTLDNVSTDDMASTVQYENFIGTVPATPLTIGATYPIFVEGNSESTSSDTYTNYYTVFFDFNRDGDFDDTGESFYIGTIVGSTGVDGLQASTNVTIPLTATPGNVVMRIIKEDSVIPVDACDVEGDYNYGQIEDYLINLLAPVACNGAPAAATVVADENTVCLNSSAQLSLSTVYENSGITYQWQSSADNITYTNVAANGTDLTYNAMQTQSTWYRALISCGANTTTSGALQIITNPILCYCDPTYEEDVEAISYVSFGTLVNPSDPEDEDTEYEDFTSLVAPIVLQGNTYTLTVGGNTVYSDENYITVYFDWNHDGEFDEITERTELGILEESTGDDQIYVEGQITIPANAIPGNTRMRIIKTYADYGFACENDDYGQAEDYLINVIIPVPCNGAPAATGIVADETTICLNSSAELSLSTVYITSGLAYQWQSSADNVTYTNVATNGTGNTYNAMQTQSTWYRVLVSCGTDTTTSLPIQILTSPELCYCDPEFTEAVEAISYVSFGTMVNPSDPEDEVNHYEDYTSITAPVVLQGSTYTLTAGGNTHFSSTNYFMVYFDWNHDGEFDDVTEAFQVGTISTSDGDDGIYATEDITIPANAALGTTRLRVVKTWGAYGNACEIDDYGQVEDYFITVDVAAGVQAFDTGAFRYHPNPVKDVLNLSYTQAISNIEVYNLVGQRVMNQAVEANEATIDMSKLAMGTYIVKVFSGNAMQAVKVIKR